MKKNAFQRCSLLLLELYGVDNREALLYTNEKSNQTEIIKK